MLDMVKVGQWRGWMWGRLGSGEVQYGEVASGSGDVGYERGWAVERLDI